MKTLFLFFSLIVSFSLTANDCTDLVKCVETVSKLTGKKYIYAEKLQGTFQSTTNFQITSANADLILTKILDSNGFARVATGEKDTYQIVSARDIRYYNFPIIECDAKNAPQIPDTADYYFLKYKFKNALHGQPRMAANSLRPFMSRYSRAIETADMIFVEEKADHLKNAYELIKSVDRELSAAEIKKYLEREQERKEERRAEMKHRKAENNSNKKSE